MDDVDAGYADYVQKWAKISEEEGIKLILCITAPYAQNAAPVDALVSVAQTEREMRTVHQLAERIKPYAAVPTALRIRQIQENGTDLTFRDVNDMHPTGKYRRVRTVIETKTAKRRQGKRSGRQRCRSSL